MHQITELKNMWRRRNKNKNLIELKGKIGKFTNKVRDFSVSLRITNGTTKQKKTKDIEKLSHQNPCRFIQYQQNTDTFQIHQISKIEHILGHKTNLSKFNKLEGYSVLYDHSGIEPKVTERWGRFSNSWKLNNTILNNP